MYWTRNSIITTCLVVVGSIVVSILFFILAIVFNTSVVIKSYDEGFSTGFIKGISLGEDSGYRQGFKDGETRGVMLMLQQQEAEELREQIEKLETDSQINYDFNPKKEFAPITEDLFKGDKNEIR